MIPGFEPKEVVSLLSITATSMGVDPCIDARREACLLLCFDGGEHYLKIRRHLFPNLIKARVDAALKIVDALMNRVHPVANVRPQMDDIRSKAPQIAQFGLNAGNLLAKKLK